MAFVILIECVVNTELLIGETYNKKIWISSAIVNLTSGLFGIIISMLLNGGWWLVVWMPWVSSNEVDLTNREELYAISIYYILAFILTVFIEIFMNLLFLKATYPRKRIIRATFITNTISYLVGSVILYTYSFYH